MQVVKELKEGEVVVAVAEEFVVWTSVWASGIIPNQRLN